jgi:phosphomethylpyrimidine synthase
MSKKSTAPEQEGISTEPFPASKKVFVPGKIHDIAVAMREISVGAKAGESNPPVFVYDTSGPYTDKDIEIDIYKGLPKLREKWIIERGDVERLPDFSSDFAHQRMADT